MWKQQRSFMGPVASACRLLLPRGTGPNFRSHTQQRRQIFLSLRLNSWMGMLRLVPMLHGLLTRTVWQGVARNHRVLTIPDFQCA